MKHHMVILKYGKCECYWCLKAEGVPPFVLGKVVEAGHLLLERVAEGKLYDKEAIQPPRIPYQATLSSYRT